MPAGFLGRFTTTFDTTSNNTYTLSFTKTTGTTTNLDVTNIIVGPGIQPQGAAVSGWLSYTPTWSGTGTPTIGNGTISGRYRRIGDTMEVQIGFLAGSTTTFGTGGWTFGIPSGFTINTTSISQNGGVTQAVGYGLVRDATGNTFTTGGYIGSATSVQAIADSTGASIRATVPFTWGSR